jgi:hypothetical protein
LLHIAILPVLLGAGERIFGGVSLPAFAYACFRFKATAQATHLIFCCSDPGDAQSSAVSW